MWLGDERSTGVARRQELENNFGGKAARLQEAHALGAFFARSHRRAVLALENSVGALKFICRRNALDQLLAHAFRLQFLRRPCMRRQLALEFLASVLPAREQP